MRRPVFVLLLFTLGGGAITRGVGQGIERSGLIENTPNLLYIIVDEMREMAMSCSGNVNLQTPALDQLAEEGARFTRMYTPYPVCSPSRASIHTGLFPHNAGVPHNGYHLRKTVPTVAEVLSEAGYYTGHIGKWHLDGADSPYAQEDKKSFDPHRPAWSGAWGMVSNPSFGRPIRFPGMTCSAIFNRLMSSHLNPSPANSISVRIGLHP